MLYNEKAAALFSSLVELADSLPNGEKKVAAELAVSLIEDFLICDPEDETVDDFVLNFLTGEEVGELR